VQSVAQVGKIVGDAHRVLEKGHGVCLPCRSEH
jgi:hypothetical protein